MLKGKIEQLFEQLESEGRLTVLSPEIVDAIDADMRATMEPFRQEMAIKLAKSEADLAKLVLNA